MNCLIEKTNLNELIHLIYIIYYYIISKDN
jgi:hypothetical protein